jgi:hypothetical protein
MGGGDKILGYEGARADFSGETAAGRSLRGSATVVSARYSGSQTFASFRQGED